VSSLVERGTHNTHPLILDSIELVESLLRRRLYIPAHQHAALATQHRGNNPMDAAPEEERLLHLLRSLADIRLDVDSLGVDVRLTEQGQKETIHRFRLNVATPTTRLSVVEECRLDLLLEERCIY